MSNLPQKQDGGGNNLALLQNLLEKHKGQIANALPKHMTPERMIRVALSAVSGNSLLMQCRPISLAACIVQSSILGLEPNSLLGEAYLVPFWNGKARAHDCQLMPGYLGMVKLARNSGQLAMIDAQPVHAKDEFDFEKGSDTWWRHKWHREGDRGHIQGYWAGYVLKDGSKNFEYMTIEQILHHRDKYSKGAYNKEGQLQGPWLSSPDWMCRKTPLKQLIKLMPKSVELATALALDERQDAGVSQAFIDVPLELQPPAEEQEAEEAPKHVVQEKPEAQNGTLSAKQQERIMALCAENKWNDKRLMALVGSLGFERLADVPASKMEQIVAEITGGAA
jgi:recombination protein RecT